MKTLKLVVGKTYRNRKGEEVKIVWRDNAGIYPFRGSDDEWYKENGSFLSRFGESSQDLIAEVTGTRHTFQIPDGVKEITLDYFGNRIVVEMVPEAKDPKPGDVMVNEHGSVYIFKEVINPNSHSQYAWLGKTGNLFIDYGRCAPGRPATPEEAQPLWDALKKAGKRWNPETMQVEDVPEVERIREWVWANLEYDIYDRGDVADAIEDYLKHKEGEK